MFLITTYRSAAFYTCNCQRSDQKKKKEDLVTLWHILVRLRVVPSICLEVLSLAEAVAGVSGSLVRWVEALVAHEAMAELVPAKPMSNVVDVCGLEQHPVDRGRTEGHPVDRGGTEQHRSAASFKRKWVNTCELFV